MAYELRLFSGNANPQLAKGIASYLGQPLSPASVSRFPDGEIKVQIHTNVRGADVFVVQPICPPNINDHLMELLIILDALKRASPARITAVIPYYAYARQDRKHSSISPITAKLIADLVTTVGPDRVLTLDLHAGQIQGYFNIPVDNLKPDPVFSNYITETKNQFLDKLVIVAPDAGATRRARRLGKRLQVKMALIDSRNEDHLPSVIGEAEENAVIVDDIVDTGKTAVIAAKALEDNGVKNIYLCATHAILSEGAIDLLNESPIKEFIFTDSCRIDAKKRSNKMTVLSVAPLLAEAIRRTHNEESVSALFAL